MKIFNLIIFLFLILTPLISFILGQTTVQVPLNEQEKLFLQNRQTFSNDSAVIWSNDYGMQLVCLNSTKAVSWECYVFSCANFTKYITQFPDYFITGCDEQVENVSSILHKKVRPIQNLDE